MKPNEVRMGRGKVSDKWVAGKTWNIIYEIGSTKEICSKCFMSAAKKLSMKCSFVKR